MPAVFLAHSSTTPSLETLTAPFVDFLITIFAIFALLTVFTGAASLILLTITYCNPLLFGGEDGDDDSDEDIIDQVSSPYNGWRGMEQESYGAVQGAELRRGSSSNLGSFYTLNENSPLLGTIIRGGGDEFETANNYEDSGDEACDQGTDPDPDKDLEIGASNDMTGSAPTIKPHGLRTVMESDADAFEAGSTTTQLNITAGNDTTSDPPDQPHPIDPTIISMSGTAPRSNTENHPTSGTGRRRPVTEWPPTGPTPRLLTSYVESSAARSVRQYDVNEMNRMLAAFQQNNPDPASYNTEMASRISEQLKSASSLASGQVDDDDEDADDRTVLHVENQEKSSPASRSGSGRRNGSKEGSPDYISREIRVKHREHEQAIEKLRSMMAEIGHLRSVSPLKAHESPAARQTVSNAEMNEDTDLSDGSNSGRQDGQDVD